MPSCRFQRTGPYLKSVVSSSRDAARLVPATFYVQAPDDSGMEVVGLCAVCHAPGALVGCPVCGLQVHARHLAPGGSHAHGGASPDPHGARDHMQPKS
jgi:hypothetical protein